MKIGDVFFEKHTIVKMSSRDPEQWAEADVEEVDAIEIPDNATNGEVIKTLFSIHKEKITDYGTIKVYGFDSEKMPTEFLVDWWNAPYKENKE